MAVTEYLTGTETVSTTEWSMTTDSAGPDADTGDGAFQAVIELNNLAVGDVFEWKLYEKCQSGSTQRLSGSARFADVQAAANWVSPCVLLMHGWDMTLKKISGTDRSISWSIRRVS